MRIETQCVRSGKYRGKTTRGIKNANDLIADLDQALS